MAITTRSGAQSGMQFPTPSVPFNNPLILTGGSPIGTGSGGPGNWMYDSNQGSSDAGSSASGTTYSSSTYAFNNPASGNSYLASFSGWMSTPGVILLADIFWTLKMTLSSSILLADVTTQTVNSPAWGARDSAGTANGKNVFLLMGIAGGNGNPATNQFTITYTNSAGTTGQSTTITQNTPTTGTMEQFNWVPLVAGDLGVKQVQTINTSGTGCSTALLVALRPLAYLHCPTAYKVNSLDALTGGFVQLYNGTQFRTITMTGQAIASSYTYASQIVVTQG